MSCTLIISGTYLNVVELNKIINIKPYKISKRGELAFTNSNNNKKNERSSFSFLSSKADFNNFKKQVNDTIKFLEKNKADLKKLTFNKNTEFSTIDFGVESTITDKNSTQIHYFPFQLIKLANDLKISIQLSVYSNNFY